jgi:transposase InsO family protein
MSREKGERGVALCGEFLARLFGGPANIPNRNSLAVLPPPRIISDNGPQFIARDFKEFIRIAGLTHVRTLAYYPQSNGKIERWHSQRALPTKVLVVAKKR